MLERGSIRNRRPGSRVYTGTGVQRALRCRPRGRQSVAAPIRRLIEGKLRSRSEYRQRLLVGVPWRYGGAVAIRTAWDNAAGIAMLAVMTMVAACGSSSTPHPSAQLTIPVCKPGQSPSLTVVGAYKHVSCNPSAPTFRLGTPLPGPTKIGSSGSPIFSTGSVQYEGQTATVSFLPTAGPEGTLVQVTGRGFTGLAGQVARRHAYFFALISDTVVPDCEIISETDDGLDYQSDEPEVSIDRAGDLTGSFRIPKRGFCFQVNGSDQPLPPGEYQVSLGNHPDYIGQVRLTQP